MDPSVYHLVDQVGPVMGVFIASVVPLKKTNVWDLAAKEGREGCSKPKCCRHSPLSQGRHDQIYKWQQLKPRVIGRTNVVRVT